MNISLNFSGGITHKSDVPIEKQELLASAIARAVKSMIEENCGSGSGTVVIGSKMVNISATSTKSLE